MPIAPVPRRKVKCDPMTELLQQAIAEVSKLSEEEQNAITQRLLDEIADEQAWQQQFDATTDTQWDKLAATVRKDITEGKVLPLDAVC